MGIVAEPIQGDSNVFRCHQFEAYFLRKERPDEAVHILVGGGLPGYLFMSYEPAQEQR